jgi:hypothetical protein
MRRAPGLDRPAGQQQAQDNTKDQLLLLCQAFHAANLTGKWLHGNNVIYVL